MQLSFYWRSQQLDVLRFHTPAPALYVSIHAPMKLARASAVIIEEQLQILDEHGAGYRITVEPAASMTAERYPMINGYVWRAPRMIA